MADYEVSLSEYATEQLSALYNEQCETNELLKQILARLPVPAIPQGNQPADPSFVFKRSG